MVAEEELKVVKLREALSEALPTYMIPSYFVQVKKLPLTPNGKVDRKALKEQNGSISTGNAYEAPRSETEQVLAFIWQEILGVDQIGLHDHFFDLGGHSLRAMMLVSRIHQKLDVEVPLRDVFQYPTLEALASAITSKEKGRLWL